MVHTSQEFENPTFKVTQNDPTPFVENTIFIELGLYYSKHCTSTIDGTVDIL